MIGKSPQGGKCRDCEDDDDKCVDTYSGKKLLFPAYKNITPSDQRCYNTDSIEKIYELSSGSLLRDPSSSLKDPTYWSLPDDLKDAGRFDIHDIFKAYTGDITIAKALFSSTFQYAKTLSVPDIVQLVDLGMKLEAERLFLQTLRFYPPVEEKGSFGNPLAIDRIISLSEKAMHPQLAALLYDRHKATSLDADDADPPGSPTPTILPLVQIIKLHAAKLTDQAEDLFMNTSGHRESTEAEDLEYLHALHTAGLQKLAAVMYLDIRNDNAHAVSQNGCLELLAEEDKQIREAKPSKPVRASRQTVDYWRLGRSIPYQPAAKIPHSEEHIEEIMASVKKVKKRLVRMYGTTCRCL